LLGVEILRSGNKETLAPDLQKTAFFRTGGFFVPINPRIQYYSQD